MAEQPEWYDELHYIVNFAGLTTASKELGIRAGTIRTWLRIPEYRKELAELYAKRFVFPEDTIRIRTISNLLRFSPSAKSQDKIFKLYNLLIRFEPPPPIPELFTKIRFAWYLDKYLFNVRKELHCRIVLTGRVPSRMLEGDTTELYNKLKEEMLEATTATAIYVHNDKGQLDDVLYFFFRNYKNEGQYGSIETLEKDLDKYDSFWDYYGYFHKGSEGDNRYRYVWTFKWRIDQWWEEEGNKI